MPVAGLVLTLCDDEGLRAHAIETLAADARVTVGDLRRGAKLPVVTEAKSLAEQQELWQALENTPGVLVVDLAFQDFSDVEAHTSEELPSRWTRTPKREESFDGSA